MGVMSEHSFFVRIHRARDNTSATESDDGKWRETGHLQIGDEIKLASGRWAKVLAVNFKGAGQVYNFTVARNHNYFVGELRLLTHNSCGDLALGLRKNLDNFADSVGAETYLKKSRLGAGFNPDEFLDFANKANQIHFNLNGFSFRSFGRWIKAGNLEPSVYYQTVTNYELYTVLTNPSLLRKTSFYMFP